MIGFLVVAALLLGGVIGALVGRRRPVHRVRRAGLDAARHDVQAGWTNMHGS